MKRIAMFFFVFLVLQTFSQNTNTTNWLIDINYIEKELLQKEFLFNELSKTKFKTKLNLFKKDLSINNKFIYWKLSKLLTAFKNPNIKIYKDSFKRFPFEVKEFSNNLYITKIYKIFDTILSYKLVAINNISVNKIKNKIKKISSINTINQLNIKSLLEYLNISNCNTLNLTVVSNKNIKTKIKLPFISTILEEELVELIPNKIPFYKQKNDRWFWSYGINYGQQVYFKYNIGLSKEHFFKMKDSLNFTEKMYATYYNLKLQDVYDAPTFIDFTDKLFQKFKKRRYKKLFIDFRNNKIGNVLAIKFFINKVKNLKRINKKNRLLIFIDKTISSSAIETILEFKKQTNTSIIGDEVIGTINNTSQINYFYLPNSKFKIDFPIQKLETIILKPDIYVKQTIVHYINGIDPILQQALEN